MKPPRVYVIVLNWNGWRDTVACLESLFRLSYEDYRVVVCDNGSSDDSVARIREWAEGKRVVSIGRDDARRKGPGAPDADLYLLENGANLGFAGGNNAGLAFALGRGDLEYVWLLNNDTVVERESLSHLVAKMQATPGAGLCGSTLVYTNDRGVQALGGAVYNPWLARQKHVGARTRIDSIVSGEIDEDAVADRVDYIVGASMLVSKAFLLDVGLMNEDYFLFFEELDWAERARGKYRLAYASRSVVHHKEGATTGSNLPVASLTSEYYYMRGRVLFTRKHHPRALPTVCLAIAGSAVKRALLGQLENAGTVLVAGLDGLRGREGKTRRTLS